VKNRLFKIRARKNMHTSDFRQRKNDLKPLSYQWRMKKTQKQKRRK
jgi:hypothetical protein